MTHCNNHPMTLKDELAFVYAEEQADVETSKREAEAQAREEEARLWAETEAKYAGLSYNDLVIAQHKTNDPIENAVLNRLIDIKGNELLSEKCKSIMANIAKMNENFSEKTLNEIEEDIGFYSDFYKDINGFRPRMHLEAFRNAYGKEARQAFDRMCA